MPAHVAVIGEHVLVRGFNLVGVSVLSADDDDAVLSRWSALSDDIGLVLLTTSAAHALYRRGIQPENSRLIVTLP
jgi:vacuolar-type H+-ATPase subunit F/Vma7